MTNSKSVVHDILLASHLKRFETVSEMLYLLLYCCAILYFILYFILLLSY